MRTGSPRARDEEKKVHGRGGEQANLNPKMLIRPRVCYCTKIANVTILILSFVILIAHNRDCRQIEHRGKGGGDCVFISVE